MAIVDATLRRYQQNGLINDLRYGTAMALSLVERGASRQAIRAKRALAVEAAGDEI